MKIVRSREFRADRAWGTLDIANMNGITTRLHWTDRPYRWHVNDGCVVLGDPAYYDRVGFAGRAGLSYPGVPAAYFMALTLHDAVPVGEVAYHPALSQPVP